jgi:hypothetical protein
MTPTVGIEWRTTAGDTPTEALRTLKRRLSDTVYRTLLADDRRTERGNR